MAFEKETKGGLFSKFINLSKNDEKIDTLSSGSDAENTVISEPETANADAFENIGAAEEVKEIKVENESEGWFRKTPAISWLDKERLNIQINANSTKARVTVTMPKDGAEETFSLGTLYEAIDKCGIVYGLQRDNIVNSFGKAPKEIPYDTPIIVAVGIEATPGTDGVVDELLPRVNKVRLEERPDGTMDFKNLHIVNNVSKGTIICNISNAVQGKIGTNIYGKPIRPAPAKMPSIPRGEGTELVELDEIHSQIIAAIDGNLIYKNSRFCVESTFKIDGNVNNSVGNIEFTGNVIVTGDVCEGYSIKTDNNVTVYGIVEGASIYSGNEIHLEKGINGMGKGVLESKGDISAKFIENCTVHCGGSIKAESIVNSIVEADGDITLVGRGTLVGGTVTAFGSVSAKTVGARSNTLINLTLGATPRMIRELDQLRQQYKTTMMEYQSLVHDVIFLEQHSEAPGNQKKLEQYRGKLNLATFKKNRLQKRIEELAREQSKVVPSTLTCNVLYPPMRLTIGNITSMINDVQNMCRYYRSEDGEIVRGSK